MLITEVSAEQVFSTRAFELWDILGPNHSGGKYKTSHAHLFENMGPVFEKLGQRKMGMGSKKAQA